ncbi:hypothetical protein [Thermomonospora amylolytica]|uniref:hypothetical protein n=1 Tax=Thermomonospora amylolytica TaxID=1411117 RepID=UPI0013006D38|nr:hypothetical protein [Thermomonospora amylolytica]
MVRRGMPRVAIMIVIAVAVNVYPALLVYTHIAGEKAVARVERCEDRQRGAGPCTGTWRDAEGRRHQGRIHGARDATGRDVRVRISPLGGAYTGGWAGYWAWMAAPVVTVGGLGLGLWMRRRLTRGGDAERRRPRRRGEPPPAQPGRAGRP